MGLIEVFFISSLKERRGERESKKEPTEVSGKRERES